MPVLTVRLHGGLERHLDRVGPVAVNLPPGATLLDLQDRLRIPRAMLPQVRPSSVER